MMELEVIQSAKLMDIMINNKYFVEMNILSSIVALLLRCTYLPNTNVRASLKVIWNIKESCGLNFSNANSKEIKRFSQVFYICHVPRSKIVK